MAKKKPSNHASDTQQAPPSVEPAEAVSADVKRLAESLFVRMLSEGRQLTAEHYAKTAIDAATVFHEVLIANTGQPLDDD